MRILVLGSGIIGTTSAYYLARQGHRVTVVDRQPSAGLETSFANAGQISPGYAAPWAAPGIPVKALKWLMSKYSPLIINPMPEWDKLKFIARMLANCNAKSYQVNKGRMLRLAEYSRHSLKQLQQETGFDYDHGNNGTLQLFRTDKQLQAAEKDIALLKRYRIPYQLLDAEGCIAVEPGLAAVRHKIVGGLRLTLDQTGDCFKFTDHLLEKCRQLGVDFRFNTRIERLNIAHGQIASISTSGGELSADAYVMALGSYSTRLLQQVGIDSPVYPVKGYSITLPVIDPEAAPVSTIMDETYKVALTRLGDRIRVAGTAELSGFDLSLNPRRRATVSHVVRDLFPDGVDFSEDNFWTGLRPMTPDGTPIVGKSRIENLFLNTGHGTLGWTMSFGSARLLADIISGKQTNIDCDDLSLARYQRRWFDPGQDIDGLASRG